MQLNGLRQQLSYLPRIGSRLMCMLFKCVYYIIQSCWKQGLDFCPDFETHSSDWKLWYGCVSDSQTIIDPARACRKDETLKAVACAGNECGKLILTTESTNLFVVSHQLTQTSSHLSYFASQGWSKACGERW